VAATVRLVLSVALCVGAATLVGAEERLAVFEFFVRTGGAYCQAGAPTVRTLQGELAGRAILLEYAYDDFNTGRVDRWWAAYKGAPSVALPLAMVGSGSDVCQGSLDYDTRYRAMLDAELARPPAASIRAWRQQVGNGLRLHLRATNLGDLPLSPENEAAFWVLVWEDRRVGLTETWVRATFRAPLTSELSLGGTAVATVDVPAIAGISPSQLRVLALLEHRLAAADRFDMLQAAVAMPASFEVTPTSLALGPTEISAVVAVEGPDALTWTATPQVSWLQVTPTTGAVPGTMTVSLVGTPSVGEDGAVQIEAAGSGMSFSTTVTVTTVEGRSRIRRRLAGVP
jgi:hypothetical protein